MRGFVSFSLGGYVLTAAVRDRLVLSLILCIAVGAGLSLFLGSAGVIEKTQFSVVYAAGGLRFVGLAGLVLFSVFYLRRAFETRDVEYLLSRPISRCAFLMSHAAAFSLIAVLIACAVVFSVFAINPKGFGAGHLLWAASIAAEYVVMANAALFFAMVVSSGSGAAMATMGLYVLARLMGELLGIAHQPLGIAGEGTMNIVMQAVSLIVPRLDLFGQTAWLIYPPDGTISYGFIALQAALYSALLMAASLVDLSRRQF